MRRILNTIIGRWKAQVPLFFKWLMGVGAAISTISIAIHTALISANAMIPEWWQTVYPYLVGMGAGMAAASKLTQTYGNNNGGKEADA